MKRTKFLFWSVGLIMLLSSASYAKIDKSDTYVPDDLVLGGGLKTLRDQFYASKEYTEQIIIVKMITKTTDPLRYDVLMDIALFDLKGADKFGKSKFTAPEARLIALRDAATTKNIKYADGYASILKYDDDRDIRVAAAESISEINSPEVVDLMINLVRYDYNYPKFREDNEKMFNDDVVVEALVTAMGKIGNPKFFPGLLQVVTKQNHRDATIKAAWKAMELLKW